MDNNIGRREEVSFKVIVAVLVALYFFWLASNPSKWHFIDGVDLVFHEAGHLLFIFFGAFLSAAGGTICQLVIPAMFPVYFYLKGYYYSAALVLFWLGQSFLNVSVYAADAQKMQLPLLGGDNSGHDWNYLLSTLNLLNRTPEVATSIYTLGVLTIGAATFLSIFAAIKKKEDIAE